MFRNKLLVILLLFLPFCAGAQKQGKAFIDSLNKELPNLKNDTGKALVLAKLSAAYSTIDPEQGIRCGLQALELSTKLGWAKGIGWANNNLGLNYVSKSDYANALESDLKAMNLFESSAYKPGLAASYSNIARVYCHEGKATVALDYDLKALTFYEALDDKDGKASVLSDLVTVYYGLAYYNKAMECIFTSLKIFEEAGDKYGIARDFKYVGDCYNLLGNQPKAIEWYFKALKINRELGDKNGIARNLEAIGIIYSLQKNFSKALEYKFRALGIFRELGDKYLTTSYLGSIGNTYLEIAKNAKSIIKADSFVAPTKEANLHKALEYNFQALKIGTEIDAKTFIAKSLGTIGETYLEIVKDSALTVKPDALIPAGKPASLRLAVEYLSRSVALSREIHDLIIFIEHSQSLADALFLSGKYKESFQVFKQFATIKDSVYSTRNKIKITNLETQRDLELKEKDILIKDKQIQIDKLEVEKKKSERIFFIIGIVLLLMVIAIVFRSFWAQKRSNKLLTIEKRRSDDLLLNILPAEVADELKDKGSADAKFFDDVTVLFTDFVGFTKVAEKMTPQQLVGELDACFKAFDGIIGKYNIEKIKTVGDAYLAVSGLPIADASHAKNVVNAALEIRKFMTDRKKALGDMSFDIRVGVHSGSVVAGIVGVKKFAYDIWGDTVNTAARMEQNSEAGKINISETTYELIKGAFECSYRGKIVAKNKGEMSMYFVLQ